MLHMHICHEHNEVCAVAAVASAALSTPMLLNLKELHGTEERALNCAHAARHTTVNFLHVNHRKATNSVANGTGDIPSKLLSSIMCLLHLDCTYTPIIIS